MRPDRVAVNHPSTKRGRRYSCHLQEIPYGRWAKDFSILQNGPPLFLKKPKRNCCLKQIFLNQLPFQARIIELCFSPTLTMLWSLLGFCYLWNHTASILYKKLRPLIGQEFSSCTLKIIQNSLLLLKWKFLSFLYSNKPCVVCDLI